VYGRQLRHARSDTQQNARHAWTAGGLHEVSTFAARALLLPRLMLPAATKYEAFLFIWAILSITENDAHVNSFLAAVPADTDTQVIGVVTDLLQVAQRFDEQHVHFWLTDPGN
jgi:hypothetical protein